MLATSTSNFQKLQYLKRSLIDEAYCVIPLIQISDSNFDCMESTKRNILNKRKQIFAYIKRFLLQTIQTEWAIAILNLIDNINEIICSLEILNQTIDKFGDALMTKLILQKWDPSIKLCGKVSLKIMKFRNLKFQLDFLIITKKLFKIAN